MENQYKKINLRDFRYNLTKLKDSLDAGQAYEVIDRGQTLAYFIPPKYKIKLTEKKKVSKEDFKKILEDAVGCAELKEEVKNEKNYKIAYRKLLEKKYLNK